MISRVVALFEGEEIVREVKDAFPKEVIRQLKMEYGRHLKIKSVDTIRNPGIHAKIENTRVPDTLINRPHKGKAYHSR